MAFSYPRKQTIMISILSALAVIGVAYYRAPSFSSSNNTDDSVSIKAKSSKESLAVSDSNKNGIADWQEQFPPEDQYASKNKVTAASSKTSEKKLTLTDRFGRSFFTEYAQLSQSGQLKDEAAVARSLDNILTNAFDSTSPTIYKISDLKKSTKDDTAALKNWMDGVSRSLDLYTWRDNEAMLAQAYVNTKDVSMLKKIDSIIAGYTRIIASLKAVQTPASASTQMVDLVNAFNTLKYSAQYLRAFNSDPLKGAVGIRAFTTGTEQLISSLENADTILTTKGLTFEVNSLVFDTSTRY